MPDRTKFILTFGPATLAGKNTMQRTKRRRVKEDQVEQVEVQVEVHEEE